MTDHGNTHTNSTLWPSSLGGWLHSCDIALLQKEFEARAPDLFLAEDEDEEVCDGEKVAVPPSLGIDIIRLESSKPVVETYQYSQEAQLLHDIRQEKSRFISKNCTTIICVQQKASWELLKSTRNALQSLLGCVNMSPAFWHVLKLFGYWEDSDHESMGGFNEEVRSAQNDSYEVSFSVKHVELKMNPHPHRSPWSIRQIGVGHVHNAETRSDVFVIVNPSELMTVKLAELSPKSSAADIYHLIMACTITQWDSHLAYLQSKCSAISQKAVLGQTPNTAKVRPFTLHFSDAQDIQKLQDDIIHVLHMLGQNLSVFEYLTTWKFVNDNMLKTSSAVRASLSSLMSRTTCFKHRTEYFLKRLEGTSTLIRSILDAQTLETLKLNAQKTKTLAVLARKDAKKATQDARRLNMITLLGLLYLPASFSASLIGTQTIHVDDSGNPSHVTLYFTGEFWAFLILTFILFSFTATFGFAWEFSRKLSPTQT